MHWAGDSLERMREIGRGGGGGGGGGAKECKVPCPPFSSVNSKYGILLPIESSPINTTSTIGGPTVSTDEGLQVCGLTGKRRQTLIK